MYLYMYVYMYSECIELIYVLQSLHPRAGYGDLTRYRCELATFIHSFIRFFSLAQPPRSAPLTPAAAARRSRTCWGRPPGPYIQFNFMVCSAGRPRHLAGRLLAAAQHPQRVAQLTWPDLPTHRQTHRQTWYIESHAFPTRTTICPLRRTNTYLHTYIHT